MSEPHNVGRGGTFSVGRHQSCFTFGRGRPVVPCNFDCTVDQLNMNPLSVPAASSTPVDVQSPPTQVITTEALSTMITGLAQQIDENITANLHAMHQPSPTQLHPTHSQPSSHVDTSQLKVVVQSDTKAPPYFKCAPTDVFSVQEWVDMMRCYLSQQSCDTPDEKFNLLMSRLSGKARDVVKVSLHCRQDLCGDELIDAVFDVLKRNFGELPCSNLPMRDFYNTVPRVGEDAMEYWIRLNKAIDAADECLRRRGRQVEDPSVEVVMMFISHCPDPTLALSFQLKPPEDWTVAEVQSRLDSHVGRVKRGVVHSQHATSVAVPNPYPVSHTWQPHLSGTASSVTDGSCCPMPSLQTIDVPGQPQLTSNPSCQHQPHTSAPLTPPVSGSQSVEPAVQQMADMSGRALSLCTASLTTGRGDQQRPGCPQSRQSHQHAACKVCGSSDHTTHAHCRLFKLCLNCFGSGHMKRDCTQAAQHAQTSAPVPSSAG